MKHILLLLILSVPVLAQDGTYEGFPVYDATTKRAVRLPVAGKLPSLITPTGQAFTATFTFTRGFDGSTQDAADRKLASYLAPYAESKGKSGLCVVAPSGACLSENGTIVYDLGKVIVAVEEILTTEIDAAVKARFIGPRLDAAREAAEDDFDREEKPRKTATVRRPRPRR